MYVVTYKIKSSGKIERKLHIGDHSESMKKSAWQKLISHIKDDNWKRLKIKNKKIVLVKNYDGNILHMKSFAKDIFVHDDIFYNKSKQIFCIGNDMSKALSMKEYTLRYGRIKCQLKKK